jgi:hypothetical protein
MTDEPIYALDLDEELLAHLPDPDAWVTLQGEGFTAELIEDQEIAQIFTWQQAYKREYGQLATATVLAEEFDIDFEPPQTVIGDLLDRIRLRYMKNGGRNALRDLINQAKGEDPLQVPQLLLQKGRELSALLSKRGDVFGTGDFERSIRRYDIMAEAGPGASFGYKELDENYNGMRGVSFLIAYKKMYKSWMMIQSVLSNVEQGRCAWLYSLELPAEETDMRLRYLAAGIPWWRYVHGKLTIGDRKALAEVSEILDGMGIFKIVKPTRGQRGIHDMVHTARDAGAQVVLIDQLQYIENDSGNSLGQMNDTGEYFGVLDHARDLSDEGPLYIAHQFGRGAAYAESMPDISLAKGSSAIEEVCTLALGMFANKAMRQSGKLEIGTLISRNTGPYDAWEIDVDLSRTTRFSIGRRIEEDDE